VNRERLSLVIAVLAIVGMCRIAWLHFVSEPRHEPVRERIDVRYAKLKPLLPPGPVGYVSDLVPAVRPVPEDSTRAHGLYLQAQYALAPVVLRPGDDRAPLVLVNLSDPGRLQQVLRAHALVLVAAVTPGLALARPR
jgi:hypothetical protein